MSAGVAIDKVLVEVGTDFDGLEKEWLAWGRKRFAAPREEGHFDRLAEWK
jgi:hypothetical protein